MHDIDVRTDFAGVEVSRGLSRPTKPELELP